MRKLIALMIVALFAGSSVALAASHTGGKMNDKKMEKKADKKAAKKKAAKKMDKK